MSEAVEVPYLAAMPDDYLTCRTLKHAWTVTQRFRVVDTRRELGRLSRGGHQLFAERRLTCDRCGMVRSDAFAITSSGGHTALRRINSTYAEIPEGYYVRGEGRLDLGLVLGAVFERDAMTGGD